MSGWLFVDGMNNNKPVAPTAFSGIKSQSFPEFSVFTSRPRTFDQPISYSSCPTSETLKNNKKTHRRENLEKKQNSKITTREGVLIASALVKLSQGKTLSAEEDKAIQAHAMRLSDE